MKLALAQINPTIGDMKGNAALVLDAAARCPHADLLVCPELCLTGYPPKDLLMHEGFLDEALAHEFDYGQAVFASRDAKEGPKAFAEKRKPKFERR